MLEQWSAWGVRSIRMQQRRAGIVVLQDLIVAPTLKRQRLRAILTQPYAVAGAMASKGDSVIGIHRREKGRRDAFGAGVDRVAHLFAGEIVPAAAGINDDESRRALVAIDVRDFNSVDARDV